VLPALMGRLPGVDTPARRARDVMVATSLAVGPDAPLSEVAKIMTEHRRKVVPVVDAAGRLLGAIDRADLLTATHASLMELSTTATLDDED